MKCCKRKLLVSAEDRRRAKSVRALRALKKKREEEQERIKKYNALLEKQVIHIYDDIAKSPDNFTVEQKQWLDRFAIEHGIEIPINYETVVNFGRTFSKSDAVILQPIFNQFLLAEELSPEDIMTLLNCLIGGFVVKNQRYVASFFQMMADKNVICKEWKSVCEQNSLLLSQSGKCLTAKDLAKCRDAIKAREEDINYRDSIANKKLRAMFNEMKRVIREIK